MKKSAKKSPAKKSSAKAKSAPKKTAVPVKRLAAQHDWKALLGEYKAGKTLKAIAEEVGLESVHCSSTWRQLVLASGGAKEWEAIQTARHAVPKAARPFVKRGKRA